jgi:hypothetical protein
VSIKAHLFLLECESRSQCRPWLLDYLEVGRHKAIGQCVHLLRQVGITRVPRARQEMHVSATSTSNIVKAVTDCSHYLANLGRLCM